MKELLDFSYGELEAFLISIGEPSYRAEQIFSWIYKKNVSDISQMTNLSKSLREKLKNLLTITPLNIKKMLTAKDGTFKFLFKLHDAEEIESVVMPYKDRTTICVSTQIGCYVGCKFCATGMLGFKRNLSTSEIVGQIFFSQKYLNTKITNVVFMGMGEPLLNYDNVMNAIYIINDKRAYNIGQRRITLSTVGIADKIEKLGQEKIKPNLAFSLHTPFDWQRDKLVPINKKYNLSKIVKALLNYRNIAHRKLTIEYVIIKNLNDSGDTAYKVRDMADKLHAKVNLIPLNPVPFFNYTPPSEKKLQKFAKILSEKVEVSVRNSKGREIQAACGQLRGEYNIKKKEGSMYV